MLHFHVASLYPMLYRLEKRGWIKGVGSKKPIKGGAATIA